MVSRAPARIGDDKPGAERESVERHREAAARDCDRHRALDAFERDAPD